MDKMRLVTFDKGKDDKLNSLLQNLELNQKSEERLPALSIYNQFNITHLV